MLVCFCVVVACVALSRAAMFWVVCCCCLLLGVALCYCWFVHLFLFDRLLCSSLTRVGMFLCCCLLLLRFSVLFCFVVFVVA